jgi:hypothetical protein
VKVMLVAVAAAAALALAAAAAADQTFNDSTNEKSGSADISSVAVANDAAAGTITFTVATNMPTLETNSEIDVLVDADHNTATGGLGAGIDYDLGLDPGGWFLDKWNGSSFADSGARDALVTFNNGTMGFKFAAADIGSPTAFNFAVLTFRGPDVNNPITDIAPDSGVWSYTLVTAPPPPTTTTTPPPPPPPAPVTIDSVTAVYAGVPKHGASFRITKLDVDLSNGVEVKATSMKCSATVGGAHLAGTGAGGCTFHLPKTSKGKKLVVRVSGRYKAKTVSNTVRLTIK